MKLFYNCLKINKLQKRKNYNFFCTLKHTKRDTQNTRKFFEIITKLKSLQKNSLFWAIP